MSKRMPGKTRLFYEQFVEFANIDNPFHSRDLERFYHFTWAAYLGRAKIDENDVRSHLVADGFESPEAEELAGIYGHCRDFMQSRGSMPYVTRKDWSG